MSHHQKRFPNETEAYRRARDELLNFEVDLRQRIAKLGELRRALPLGGALKEDYIFQEFDSEENIVSTRFSDLFSKGKNTLLIYSFMYGPQMEQPCPACTSLIDGFSGIIEHLEDRIDVAIIARSPIERIEAFADTRRWKNLRLLSSAENTYNADYFAETEEGVQLPAANVFTRNENGIFHFFNTELLYADLEGHPRHMDLAWPIWNILDMTPEGRGDNWGPKLRYEKLRY